MTEKEAARLKREAERAEEQRIAELSGGVPKEVTAAQAQEYEEEPPIDPVSGRPSLVRALAQREANAGGAQFPKGTFPRPGVRRAGGGAVKSGGRASSLWQSLGDAFRRGEGEVHRSLAQAGGELQRLNPGESKHQVSQRLFDYLAKPDKEVTDPELEGDVNALRERIPVIAPEAFDNLKQLQKGMEAVVFHDQEGRVVYKLFKVRRRSLVRLRPCSKSRSRMMLTSWQLS